VSSRRRFLKTVGAAAAAVSGACASRGSSASRATPAAPATPATPATAATPASRASVIRLGSNENSFGPGPAALEGIRGACTQANRYPFRVVGELSAAIAARHGLGAGQVLLGSGSGELLNAVVSEFTSADHGLVSASPTFEMPANRAEELHRPVRAVRVDASGRLDLDAMVAAAAGAGVIYVCNPNNPTATVHGGADVRTFIEAVHKTSPDALILVDEAYHEYVASPAYETAVPIAAVDPRVVVTRTFSKIHGMAGLRVGYAVGTAATLARLGAWVDPMNMNAVGLGAAAAALGDAAHVASQQKLNAEGRARLRAAFDAAGYTSFESDANFLMVHVRRDPRSFAASCLAQGVQVARPFPPLLEHARITIGTPEEMDRATRVFLAVLAAPARPPQTARAWWPDDARGC